MNDRLRYAWLLGLLTLVLAVIVGPHEHGLIWLLAVYLVGANVSLLVFLRQRA
ncbi:MAG: hypothetical protein LC789_07255 [Actinobacteria bacterium]|nr:hypothetical protein [Actinomycetota bacterium]MCA1720275.1 hypothetical protein [Actinomycetota bacterium]